MNRRATSSLTRHVAATRVERISIRSERNEFRSTGCDLGVCTFSWKAVLCTTVRMVDGRRCLHAQKWINPQFDVHRLDFRDLGYVRRQRGGKCVCAAGR